MNRPGQASRRRFAFLRHSIGLRHDALNSTMRRAFHFARRYLPLHRRRAAHDYEHQSSRTFSDEPHFVLI